MSADPRVSAPPAPCTGGAPRKALRSKAEAKAAQAEAKRIYGVAMRRYRCPFCGHHRTKT